MLHLEKYFLYRHIRLDKNEVFYIGVGTKTVNPKKQNYNEIYRRAFLKSVRSNFWKNIVAKTKYKVEIFFESNSYEEIENKEKEFINLYGRKELGTGTLVNMTDGGKGQKNVHLKKHSDSTKAKMSLSSKGKPKSIEHREKLSQSKLDNPTRYWAGKQFSEEHKLRLRHPKNKKCKNFVS